MKRIMPIILAGLAIVIGLAYYFYTSTPPVIWALDGADSSVSFTSIKNDDIEEVHTISGLTGRADITGEFSVTMDLKTVETNIDIRNQRMNEFLFETETYGVATFSGPFELDEFIRLPVGGSLITRIVGTLSLHGVDQSVAMDVEVVRIAEDAVIISSLSPIQIDSADFNLLDGLDTLQDLAGLDNISPVSEVSFTIVYRGRAHGL